MYFLHSPSTDPAFNLALEQVVFEGPSRFAPCCMLWQNHNTIVVGKHQNTLAEIDSGYVKARGIQVVRRLSGGGAVYHDLGNVNFTFIAPHAGGKLDFSQFCIPVIQALADMGVKAERSGRNDMTIEGRKFSGNSQYVKNGRVMHHGTILYDSDLTMLSGALRVSQDKIVSKGLASVRSRVTNVRPYTAQQPPTPVFLEQLRQALFRQFPMEPCPLTEAELARAARLRDEVYASWEWTYGASPPCNVVKRRRVEGCGTVEVHMQVEQGRLAALTFYGDFFSLTEPAELAAHLLGCPLEEGALRARLAACPPEHCFQGMDAGTFSQLLLE